MNMDLMCFNATQNVPAVVKQGLNGSDIAIIVILLAALAALIFVAAKLSKNLKSYRIHSVDGDFYANETDKVFEYSKQLRARGSQDAMVNDNDEDQIWTIRIKM